MTVLFRSKKLSKSEKLVALALAFKIDYTGVTRMTQAEIGVMASLTPKGVRTVLQRLTQKIQLEVRKEKGRNTYYFIQWVQI